MIPTWSSIRMHMCCFTKPSRAEKGKEPSHLRNKLSLNSFSFLSNFLSVDLFKYFFFHRNHCWFNGLIMNGAHFAPNKSLGMKFMLWLNLQPKSALRIVVCLYPTSSNVSPLRHIRMFLINTVSFGLKSTLGQLTNSPKILPV